MRLRNRVKLRKLKSNSLIDTILQFSDGCQEVYAEVEEVSVWFWIAPIMIGIILQSVFTVSDNFFVVSGLVIGVGIFLACVQLYFLYSGMFDFVIAQLSEGQYAVGYKESIQAVLSNSHLYSTYILQLSVFVSGLLVVFRVVQHTAYASLVLIVVSGVVFHLVWSIIRLVFNQTALFHIMSKDIDNMRDTKE